MHRRLVLIPLTLVTVGLSAAALAITAGADPPATSGRATIHLLLREDTQYIDAQPPAGPSAGDIVILKGDLLNPGTKRPIGFAGGHCTIVDVPDEGREVCEIIFTPDTRHAVAESDQITTQTFFDLVNDAGPQRSAITGGTGKYSGARGEVIADDTGAELIPITFVFNRSRS